MSKLQKPGENPYKPGEYKETGPRGGDIDDPRQVTIEPEDTPLTSNSKTWVACNGETSWSTRNMISY